MCPQRLCMVSLNHRGLDVGGNGFCKNDDLPPLCTAVTGEVVLCLAPTMADA
jgi:hypothetical protein